MIYMYMPGIRVVKGVLFHEVDSCVGAKPKSSTQKIRKESNAPLRARYGGMGKSLIESAR